jgi:site-specific DNA-methyltransferase (adenine-specific)
VTPYYQQDGITIYHGDCREIAPNVKADVVVSDPPYGMDWNTDHTRFSVGRNGDGMGRKSSQKHERIKSDDEPFDPSPWLGFKGCVLWGFHHFAARLPKGSALVWIKRYDSGFGSFLSDADLAWMKGGHGVYCFRDVSLQAESKFRLHPTQKPEPLMRWCIEKASVHSDVIIDPYMGSGTTLVAAKRMGRTAIGIEVKEHNCEIAAKRLSQGSLFGVAQDGEATTGCITEQTL